MKTSLSRILYYITLLCIFLAILHSIGFGPDDLRYLFMIHMIIYDVSNGPPDSAWLHKMLKEMTFAGGFCMLIGGVITILGMVGAIIAALHLHLLVLDKTEVKEKT